MNRTFLLLAVLIVIVSVPVSAQDSSDDRLGKTCDQILAMKVEDWSELYVKQKQGGEVGYDQAYEVYAECMKKKNDTAAGKLPATAAQRLQKYRKLCGGFREDALFLEQAYAGGGTMYTHAAARGQVDDEQLIASLLRIYHKPSPGKSAGSSAAKIAKIRKRITALNPNTARNRKKLAEFSMGDQGKTAYASYRQRLDAIAAILPAERQAARSIVIKFLDDYSKPSISEQ